MNIKNTIISNTIVSGAASLVVSLLSFIFIPYILGQLGVEKFGVYGMLLMFSSVGYVSLLEFGLLDANSKQTAYYLKTKDYDKLSSIFSTALVILLIIGILLGTLGYFISPYIVDYFFSVFEKDRVQTITSLQYIFVANLLLFPNFILTGALQGAQKFVYAKGSQTISTLINYLLILIFLYNDPQLSDIFNALMLSSFTHLLMNIYFIKKDNSYFQFNFHMFNFQTCKELWGISKYLSFGKISSLIYTNTDRVIIGLLGTSHMMANFEILIKIPRFIKSIIGLGSGAIMPMASLLSVNENLENKRQKKLLIKAMKFNCYFFIPFGIFAIIYSPQIINVWVGKDFLFLTNYLRVLIVWSLLGLFSNIGGGIIVGTGIRLKQYTYLSYGISFIKVLLLFLLFKSMELWAIVISSLLSLLIFTPFLFHQYIAAAGAKWFDITGIVVKSVLYSAVVFLSFNILLKKFNLAHWELLVYGGIFSLIVSYVVLLFTFLDKDDRKILFINRAFNT